MASAKSRYTPFFSGPTPVPVVDHRLGVARLATSRGTRLPNARVLALEVVVALVLGDLVGRAGVVGVLRHPDAAVVAQRLRHERELRLELVALRDARRVDLRVARVGEVGARAGAPARWPWRCRPWRWSTGRRRSSSRRWPAPRRGPACELISPVTQVAHDDAGARARRPPRRRASRRGCTARRAEADLAGQRLVGAEQQLLAGLAAGVERAADLGAAEASGCRAGRRTRGRRARPGPRTGR